MISSESVLYHYWKHESFREPQKEIIEHVLANKDCIALLPTGGGKSICYQIPALLKEGICIVISPLIALIEDQIDSLQKKNIKVASIPSGKTENEIIALFDNLKYGNFKFLYLSPERLQSRLIQEKIKELNVNLIAVDEAHCISEWGHDFRPSYRKISILKNFFPDIPCNALTATANSKVLHDINENLGLENAVTFKKSFFREGLAYQVFTVENKLLRLKQIFTKTKSPGIVYVSTRKKAEEIANYLNENGFPAAYYHGGLDKSLKTEAFEAWMSETKRIMVSTNAFGMGIDKGNVGIVVHFDIPYSIENYIQESGRAGRNLKKAFAVLLKNEHDISMFKQRQKEVVPSMDEIKKVHKKLYQFLRVSLGEKPENALSFDLNKFCHDYDFKAQKVRAIFTILENYGIIENSKDQQNKSTIQFMVDSKKVISYAINNIYLKNFIDSLLRTYTGLFQQIVYINEFELAKKNSCTSSQVIQYLEQLHKDEILIYEPSSKNSKLMFLVPREDDRTINRHEKEINNYLKQKNSKTRELLDYISNNSVCRSIQLLGYFDEPSQKKCGICDVCLRTKKKTLKILNQKFSICWKLINH